MKKRIAILGSTGSIGTQALDVINTHSDLFQVEVLTAGNNADLLIEQALHFQPNCVVIDNKDKYEQVFSALDSHDIKVFAGSESVEQVVEMSSVDMVLVALVGYAGLRPTYNALMHHKPVALANKETLVAGGTLITKAARENRMPVYPVDSEHSAIFQCLTGEGDNEVEKILLTASGGPFRGWKRSQLSEVTKEQALKHPNWSMGRKVTIDSASLMNKGLEMIEARWLFDVQPEQIEVVVHPQSVIHSMVQFRDGSVKAQLGTPDMRLPIQYALSYPDRLVNANIKRINFAQMAQLTFEQPDSESFKCLNLAHHAIAQGGNMPCVMNAANEVAVEAFLNDKLKFLQIPELIERCMSRIAFKADPSMDDLFATDSETRKLAEQFMSVKN